MKTTMIGCGNTICKFNNFGECQRKRILLGADGSCLIFQTDLEKSEIVADIEVGMQKIAAVASQKTEALQKENESETRKVEF